MKNILLSCCLFILISPIIGQVYVTGSIKNASDTSEVNLTYYNNNIEWKDISIGKTKLDNKGNFHISFNLDKAKLMKLLIGNQLTFVFLEPKDSIHISNDFNNFDSTIIYTGRGASNNNYMAKDIIAEFEKKASRYSAFEDANKYKLFEDSIEKLNWEFYKANETPEFTTAFKNYMTTTIKYRFINSRWMYKFGINKTTNSFYFKPVPKEYYDFLKTIDLNDQNAIDNGNYTNALMRYISEMNDKYTSFYIPDSLSKQQKMEMQVMINYNYRKMFFSDKILDLELTTLLIDNIEFIYNDTGFCESLLKDYKVTCKNPEYIAMIDRIYQQSKKLSIGNIAPDFTLMNAEGKEISLFSLRGKTVYIDFWATWCLPCMISMKHSKELMEKLKDRNDIVFLYVNVTDDKERWKNYLIKENWQGINLYANKEESAKIFEDYNIKGIPKFVLIDKNSRIINSNESDPINIEKNLLDASKK